MYVSMNKSKELIHDMRQQTRNIYILDCFLNIALQNISYEQLRDVDCYECDERQFKTLCDLIALSLNLCDVEDVASILFSLSYKEKVINMLQDASQNIYLEIKNKLSNTSFLFKVGIIERKKPGATNTQLF